MIGPGGVLMDEPIAWRTLRQTAKSEFGGDATAISRATLRNMEDLLDRLSGRSALPRLRFGEEGAMILVWDMDGQDRIEVVVFPNRYDLYRYRDERRQIRLVDHEPGEPIPDDLLRHLPILSG